MNPRRELGTAVALCAAAGAAGLVSGGRTWLAVRIDRPAPLPPVAADLTGSQVAPLVSALSVVVLAGVVGLLATRRWGRAAVGVVLAAAGAGMLITVLPWLGGVSAATARGAAFDAGLAAGVVSATSAVPGPVLTVVAGAIAALVGFAVVGLAVVGRGNRWPALGARFEAPAARQPAGQPTAQPREQPTGQPTEQPTEQPAEQPGQEALERATWDALDRGEDPTRPGAPESR